MATSRTPTHKRKGEVVVDTKRLYNAVIHSRLAMAKYRETRVECIREYVGGHYSEEAAPDRVPINMIELGVTVFSRNLVAARPRTLVSTAIPEHKGCSALLELAINHRLTRMKFGEMLKRLTIDSMFGPGVVKIGLDSDGHAFLDRVDLDDYYVDMKAKSRDRVQWEGDRYVLLLDEAVEMYGEKVKQFAQNGISRRRYNEGGDDTATAISGGDDGAEQAFDEVALLDIYIPSENKVYTFPAPLTGVEIDGDWDEPLREEDWEGPEGGPYRVLGYSYPPGNVLPIAPVSQWLDQHDLSNRLFRKLGRQAERQKTITLVRPGKEEDGERIRDAADGEIITTDDPNSVGQVSFGGADNVNLAFLLQVRDLWSWFAGNLDALGGLSAQSSTATQDSLLHESASKRLASMQSDILDFTAELVRCVAWYLWNDDSVDIDVVRTLGDLKIEIPAKWTAKSKRGDFIDYAFEIEPYSLQFMTPAGKTQAIMALWQQVILPGAQYGLLRGEAPDMTGMLRTLAKLMNLPEIEDIVTFVDPDAIPGQPQAGSPSDMASRKPANTTRRYIRENVPTGGTPQGRTAVAVQSLLGANPQEKQQASLGQGGPTPARM